MGIAIGRVQLLNMTTKEWLVLVLFQSMSTWKLLTNCWAYRSLSRLFQPSYERKGKEPRLESCNVSKLLQHRYSIFLRIVLSGLAFLEDKNYFKTGGNVRTLGCIRDYGRVECNRLSLKRSS